MQKPLITQVQNSISKLIYAKKDFSVFINPDRNFCFDVLDGPNGNDARLRPNQLKLVSLKESPLSQICQKHVFESVSKELYTTYGIRTLSQNDSIIIMVIMAEIPWKEIALIIRVQLGGFFPGIFIQLHLAVYKDPEKARTISKPHTLSSDKMPALVAIVKFLMEMPR